MGRVSKVIFPKGKDLKPVPGRLAPKQAVPAMTVTPAMPENPKTRLALQTLATLAATQMVQQDLLHQAATGTVFLQMDPKGNMTLQDPKTVLQVRAATAMSQHPEIRPLPMEPAELLAYNRTMVAEIRKATLVPTKLLRSR